MLVVSLARVLRAELKKLAGGAVVHWFRTRKDSMYRPIHVSGAWAVAAFVMLASSAWAEAEPKSTFSGYLVDKQCADSVRDDSDALDFIRHHTKDCSLMINCRRTGYSLYVKPDWYDLDKHGNKLAIKLLQNSRRKNGFYVDVEGSLKTGVLRVKSMKEIQEPAERNSPEVK